jgi:hypothetical protein
MVFTAQAGEGRDSYNSFAFNALDRQFLESVKPCVSTLVLCCQVDHFVFRISHFASGKQLPVGIRPDEKWI